MDKELLQAIPTAQADENSPVFFQTIELRFADGTTEKIFETEKKGNCFGMERFVAIEGKKAVVYGVVCRE
jgi:alpha-galactosidase